MLKKKKIHMESISFFSIIHSEMYDNQHNLFGKGVFSRNMHTCWFQTIELNFLSSALNIYLLCELPSFLPDLVLLWISKPYFWWNWIHLRSEVKMIGCSNPWSFWVLFSVIYLLLGIFYLMFCCKSIQIWIHSLGLAKILPWCQF